MGGQQNLSNGPTQPFSLAAVAVLVLQGRRRDPCLCLCMLCETDDGCAGPVQELKGLSHMEGRDVKEVTIVKVP